MTDLPEALRAALTQLAARGEVLAAVDFDGVLAPIVDDPSSARAIPGARSALADLVGLPGVHVAIVSGRALVDLRRVADAPAETVLVGSHGAELDDAAGREGLDADAADLLHRIAGALHSISETREGTHVELKPSSAVLHTRLARRPTAAAAAREVLTGPAAWAGVHLMEGKEVLELSVLDVTKGTALQRLRVRLGLPPFGCVLYVGDDVTDEQAFAVLDDDDGDVTVKVGPGTTAARHRVDGPADVAEVLRALATARRLRR